MALEFKLGLKLGQGLVMTPQLQQAIKLLQLNRLELAEVINQELVENPVLEESGETSDGESSTLEGESPAAGNEDRLDPEAEQRRDEEAFQLPAQGPEEQLVSPTNTQDDFNWENYMEESGNSGPTSASMREVNEELPSFENALTKTTTLEDHLNWQLSMITLTQEEKKLGQLILGNLGDDGYLGATIEDLAKECELEVEDAEEILKMIQNFDPIGVASRNLQECLSIQAKLLSPRQPIVEQIIEKHLPDLERKNYTNVTKALGITMDQVFDATRVIMEFEPKPARNFQTNDTHYITPDIYVYKVAEEFVVVLNDDGLPRLRISPYYKGILQAQKKAPATGEAKTDSDNKLTKDYVQDKLRSAIWLIRSIQHRQKTIYKVTEAIVKRQRDFFEKGVQNLKPMILKDIASDVGMHESTISRVTTNKYVHTPVGIFELKYFFNSSINASDGGDSLASESVKERIRQMISKEDPKNPLSDQKIVELLVKDNIEIARRTVAKYREMLSILSSAKRKQIL